MATKAELEAEVASLRQKNEDLRSAAAQSSEAEDPQVVSSDADLSKQLSNSLKEHGIDTSDLEALGKQLASQVAEAQKEYPLATLVGAFVVGFVVGRALK